MNYENFKTQTLQKLIATQKEYINLLVKEIESLCPIAHAHGWRSENYERGEELRCKIKYLTEKVVSD